MKEKVDDIFKTKLGNVQVPPAAHVKAGLVKQVSAMIVKNTIISTTVIVTGSASVGVAGKVVYDHLTEDQENHTSVITAQEESSEVPAETAQYTDYLEPTGTASVKEHIVDDSSEHLSEQVEALQTNSSLVSGRLENIPSAVSGDVSTPNTNPSVLSAVSPETEVEPVNSFTRDSRDHVESDQLIKTEIEMTSLEETSATSATLMDEMGYDPFIDEFSLLQHSNESSNTFHSIEENGSMNSRQAQLEALTNDLFRLKKAYSEDQSNSREYQIVISSLEKQLEELKQSHPVSPVTVPAENSEPKAIIPSENFSESSIQSVSKRAGLLPSANAHETDAIFIHHEKQGAFFNNWSFGVMLGYSTLEDLSLVALESEVSQAQSELTSTLSSITTEITRDLGKVNLSAGVGVQKIDQDFELSELFTESGVQEAHSSSFTYISIPLSAEYSLIDAGRNQFGINGGVNFNQLTAAKGSFFNQQTGELEILRLGSDAVNKNLTSFYMGLTMSKAITNRLFLRINPSFRIISSDLYATNEKSGLNYSGLELKTGLQIKL